jgi:3-deoxy-D-manno-octulosonate 8-phosphate phosphatase (KDO 8-P phosphatase)
VRRDLLQRARRVRIILMDVDGVLTDGGIILGPDGVELKRFDVQDGMGITLAREAGLLVGIITGRRSAAVEQRAGELAMDEVHQGHARKDEALDEILRTRSLDAGEVAYIGDDVQDVPLLRRIGMPICVANATREARQAAVLVTKRPGGHGAVREVIDLILAARSARR